MEMKYVRRSWFRRLMSRLVLRRRGSDMTSFAILSSGGGVPIRQTKLAPDGVEFSEDVSEARWVEERLSDSNMSTVRSLLPNGFPAYARVFHPAYLNDDEEQPVRWSTVASWTGRTVHPLMQFDRVAGLPEGPHVNEPDQPWGSRPTVGSIPEAECRTLVETLRGFTTIPDICYFCLWDGWGNIDTRLYKAGSRVRAPHRDHLLFRGPIDAIMAFLATDWPRGNVWSNSPNLWWPEDRAWCVATDIDLCHTYIGGSRECIEAILSHPDLEALPTTLHASTYLISDIINAPEKFQGGSE